MSSTEWSQPSGGMMGQAYFCPGGLDFRVQLAFAQHQPLVLRVFEAQHGAAGDLASVTRMVPRRS
jgi:hypothetical protein